MITDGSVQADENLYWYAAQTLAKEGYVVLTFDPQGQGQSDTYGQGRDRNEGVPAQTDGRPFYDGTDTRRDRVVGPGAPYRRSSSLTPCGRGHDIKFRVRRFHGQSINRVKAYVDGRLVLTVKGRNLRSVSVPPLAGNGRHTVRVYEYTGKDFARRITRRVRGCGARG